MKITSKVDPENKKGYTQWHFEAIKIQQTAPLHWFLVLLFKFSTGVQPEMHSFVTFHMSEVIFFRHCKRPLTRLFSILAWFLLLYETNNLFPATTEGRFLISVRCGSTYTVTVWTALLKKWNIVLKTSCWPRPLRSYWHVGFSFLPNSSRLALRRNISTMVISRRSKVFHPATSERTWPLLKKWDTRF